MIKGIPVGGVVPIEQMIGDEEEDTTLLLDMSNDAQQFLASFSWFGAVRDSYFGGGIGGVVAIFFFHIDPIANRMDEWLWVVVGNVPPAYLVIDNAKNPVEALDIYLSEMSRWVKLARKGITSEEVIPVNVPATPEWAEILAQRLRTIQDTIRPEIVARASGLDRE